MGRSKITYHIAANCGGCTGIGDYWRALGAASVPFAVCSVNDPGAIIEGAKYASATLIYRDVEASTVEPRDYAHPPEVMASAYWDATRVKMPPEIRALKGRVWIELFNEPGREPAQANWIGWMMYHMARRAIADGYRVCGPGWAAGNPEPEAWLSPGWRAYLTLCAELPQQAAVTLHEYSLSNDIHAGESWLIGRFRFLFDACDELGIARPTTFITECGWTLNSMPPDVQAKKDIDYLARLYAEHHQIKSVHLWTLQSGAGNGNLPQRLNALMPWLQNYTLTTTLPDPSDTPPSPPTGDKMNKLINGSFEGHWSDATAFPGHIPAAWICRYNTGSAYPNPFAARGGTPYQNGEAVKKHKVMLPQSEQSVFVWDGEWTYKIFGGGDKPFWFEMEQSVVLAPGRYTLATPVWVDHYRSLPGGKKDYKVDDDQAQIEYWLGDTLLRGWKSLKPSGQRHDESVTFDWPGGVARFTVGMRSNWGINGNFWVDGWSLLAVPITDPPTEPGPGTYKAIIVKLPQDVTRAEWTAVGLYAFDYKHDMTASHDSMLALLKASGRSDSYVKLAYPQRQKDVAKMIEDAGYSWIPIFESGVTPPF